MIFCKCPQNSQNVQYSQGLIFVPSHSNLTYDHVGLEFLSNYIQRIPYLLMQSCFEVSVFGLNNYEICTDISSLMCDYVAFSLTPKEREFHSSNPRPTVTGFQGFPPQRNPGPCSGLLLLDHDGDFDVTRLCHHLYLYIHLVYLSKDITSVVFTLILNCKL